MKSRLYPNAGYLYFPVDTLKVLSWDGPGATTKFSGYFRCILRERDGTVVQDTGWFPNIITDNGMKKVTSTGTSSTWFGYCEIGEGTGTPLATDTTLFTPIPGISRVYKNTVASALVNSSHYWRRYKWRFEEGNGTGSIKELALFDTSTGGTMWNHALIVDGGGTPTTIVKGAEQVLDVFYEIRNYPVLIDQTGTFDLSGVSYDYTLRPIMLDPTLYAPKWNVEAIERFNFGVNNLAAYTGGTLGLITDEFPTDTGGGSVLNPTLYYDSTHNPNSYYTHVQETTLPYYTESLAEIGIDAWHGTIDTLRWSTGNSCWQIEFEKTVGGGGIPKTNEQRLRLWARAYADRL